jgi:hypothetical protein
MAPTWLPVLLILVAPVTMVYVSGFTKDTIGCISRDSCTSNLLFFPGALIIIIGIFVYKLTTICCSPMFLMVHITHAVVRLIVLKVAVLPIGVLRAAAQCVAVSVCRQLGVPLQEPDAD